MKFMELFTNMLAVANVHGKTEQAHAYKDSGFISIELVTPDGEKIKLSATIDKNPELEKKENEEL